uniref:SGNH hydrolase-type esterase domain-containing protein n=1 Tax=Racemicystis crocea TaxID=1707966 RepID=A0A3S7V0K5_9BACT|nr:hypothetical protein [Racemicystis crocea]
MRTSPSLAPLALTALALVAACAPSASPRPATEHAASAPSVRRARAASAPLRAAAEPPKAAAAPEAPRATAEAAATAAPAMAEPPPIPPNTAVLHVGDSFTNAGFSQALRPKMHALGVRYEVRAEDSSYTTSWASKLGKLVADIQPDLVIISLGANEVENTEPVTHAPAVRRIVRAIGGRPCVWVSPPLWRKDTGITEVIRENSAPCRFFDSDAIVTQAIPRQRDHIHPNKEGGAIWAEAFWAWLERERAPRSAADDAAPPSRPWALKPAPPAEHAPKRAAGDASVRADRAD